MRPPTRQSAGLIWLRYSRARARAGCVFRVSSPEPTHVDEPGCYAYPVDGADFSLVIVLEAVLEGSPAAMPTLRPDPPGSVATPHPNGRYRSSSRSERIEHGRPYRYRLDSHCGLARSHVDIDGSFWEPVEPGPTGNPAWVDSATRTTRAPWSSTPMSRTASSR